MTFKEGITLKKIILTVFLLSLLFITPSYAKGTLYINDQEKSSEPIIIINGTTYVPVRLVAENLGAQVSYDGDVHISNDSNSNQLRRPEIIGSENFRVVMNKALNLLEKWDFSHYTMVCQNVNSIMAISDDEVAFIRKNPLEYYEKRQIKINQGAFKTLDLFIPEIMASAIVHDCTHFVQFRYGYYETQNKQLADVQAYMNEITTLSLLGSPEWYIDYVFTKLFEENPDVNLEDKRQAVYI
ncbi:MAG: copper amine oxidase N-terminal domain-containing protein [Firmicutes bacterium]|nr:copper amine oxidase N-terminal domain-containing protein [Bacillota bacterium]